ncbi:hypothetical protein [Methanobacterium sp. ACI-7]|uniref:hypothetical protein n=1 Tax=unclassified Methanobacterium TaxID=2627676 RepID=UPI0039C2FDA4
MTKNPLFAGILSLIIPGLGYIYVGKTIIGLIVMIMFFTLNILVYYSYLNHSIFPGIPELAFINLWPFFYFIWIPLAYDVYRTAKKGNKIKSMGKHSQSNEKVNKETNSKLTCPECYNINPESAENCQKCGKNLKEILFFSKGKLSDMPDVEMTKRFLIVYKNNIFGKRSGKIDKYYLNKMGKVEINDNIQYGLSPLPFKYVALNFSYGDKTDYYKSKKTVYIREKDIYDLIGALKIRKISFIDNYHVERI